LKNKIAISLSNVSKTYKVKAKNTDTIRESFRNPLQIFGLKYQNIQALNSVNLKISRGEKIGVIGRNGSGKSTLLNIIMGSIPYDEGGTLEKKGKLMRLALGMGIDPNLTGRDNIYVNGSILGLSFKEIGNVFDEIIDFADVHDFINTPVKFYSKGMKQRLLFSIALYAKADVILLDEFFGGTGDEDFKIKSDMAFRDKIMSDRTIVIVSHSMGIIQKHCERVMWLEKGNVMAIGPANEVVRDYREFIRQHVNKNQKGLLKNHA